MGFTIEFDYVPQPTEKQMRWHKFYLRLAEMFASMSKDPRLKVGCIIVTENGIIYPGINGLEIGGSNEVDSLEEGKSGCVHAEFNSLIRLDASLHKKCKLFCNVLPCPVCSRAIINTKAISEVYYIKEYRDRKGIQILRNCGIVCEQIRLED